MGLGEQIIIAIEARRDRKRKNAREPYGDFYRHGGNELLYDMPIKSGDLIINAGGFEGVWTAAMITRYGHRSEICEPVPSFATHCKRLFAINALDRILGTALGSSARIMKFGLARLTELQHSMLGKVWCLSVVVHKGY